MGNALVKILENEDGEKQRYAKWHLVVTWGDSPRTLCTGEVFGYGEGSAMFKRRFVESGGITCPECLKIIHEMKKIKL
jgi:hypothetical protein